MNDFGNLKIGWNPVLLLLSPFFLPSLLGGKRKGERITGLSYIYSSKIITNLFLIPPRERWRKKEKKI